MRDFSQICGRFFEKGRDLRLRILPVEGEGDDDVGALAHGALDVQSAPVEPDDVAAHREADARAPALGAALIKLLLDEGELVRGDAAPDRAL